MKDLTEDGGLYMKLYELIDNSIEYDWSDAVPSVDIDIHFVVDEVLKVFKEYIENEAT